jgi:hypothetical protein
MVLFGSFWWNNRYVINAPVCVEIKYKHKSLNIDATMKGRA